jgi:hypothetical protein
LDPIAYQVYQNRLRETQRSNDSLRVEQKKEIKDSSRLAEIASQQGGGEQQSIPDEMMGDTDFAELLGGGQGSHTDVPLEEEELDESDEREGGTDGDEPEGQAGRGAPSEEEADGEEPPEIPWEEPVGPERIERSPELLEEAGRKSVPLAAAEAAHPQVDTGSRIISKEIGPRAPSPATAIAGPSAQPLVEKANGPSARAMGSRPPLPSLEIKLAPAPLFKGSSRGSMLDLSGGFLLGEETGFHSACAAEEVGPEVSHEGEKQEALSPDLADLLGHLVIGDISGPAGRKLLGLLSRFGHGVLSSCLSSRVKVCLLPRGELVGSHPLVASCGLGGATDAVYLKDARSVLVEEDCLLSPPYGFQPVIFYFAHAWDHALGGEKFASELSPAVQASFQVFRDSPHRFSDRLAAASPAHYFAQAVEAYLGAQDCKDVIWSRDDLRDFDRLTCDYVEYLFKRSNPNGNASIQSGSGR